MPRHFRSSAHLNPTPTTTGARIFHEAANSRVTLPPIHSPSNTMNSTKGRFYTFKPVGSGVIPAGYDYQDAFNPSKTFPKTFAVGEQAKTTLHDGICHVKEGRTWKYLQERNREDPEDKYTLPVTETQLMAWGIYPPPQNCVVPTQPHGRRETMKHTFYNKNLQGSLAHSH